MNSAGEILRERAATALAARQGLPSPCVSVCRMSPLSGLCEGCLRSLEEIAAWSRMGDEGKRLVWRGILARMDAAQPQAAP